MTNQGIWKDGIPSYLPVICTMSSSIEEKTILVRCSSDWFIPSYNWSPTMRRNHRRLGEVLRDIPTKSTHPP